MEAIVRAFKCFSNPQSQGLYSFKQKHGQASHKNTPVPGTNFCLLIMLLPMNLRGPITFKLPQGPFTLNLLNQIVFSDIFLFLYKSRNVESFGS